MSGDNGSEKKAPGTIHTCPFRNQCWAELDDRTLGMIIRVRKLAQKYHRKHRLPYQTRPKGQSCGFEATELKWCQKYNRWARETGLAKPEPQLQQTTLEL